MLYAQPISARAGPGADPKAARGSLSLRRAEEIFVELGARLWLERARRDLARTGLTRSLDRELTPTEVRVAELAAAGSRNKEIAGALFVSVKSVEAHLSRVYAKYGVRSIPTVILFASGAVQDTLIGVQPQKRYVERIDTLIKGGASA